jgi:hypothetical protein
VFIACFCTKGGYQKDNISLKKPAFAGFWLLMGNYLGVLIRKY